MRIFLFLLTLLCIGAAYAQSIGNSGIVVNIAGTGSSGGGGVVACSNQLVLDYSNSCALIGQGWGE